MIHVTHRHLHGIGVHSFLYVAFLALITCYFESCNFTGDLFSTFKTLLCPNKSLFSIILRNKLYNNKRNTFIILINLVKMVNIKK